MRYIPDSNSVVDHDHHFVSKMATHMGKQTCSNESDDQSCGPICLKHGDGVFGGNDHQRAKHHLNSRSQNVMVHQGQQ
jgi:hypothetical protein